MVNPGFDDIHDFPVSGIVADIAALIDGAKTDIGVVVTAFEENYGVDEEIDGEFTPVSGEVGDMTPMPVEGEPEEDPLILAYKKITEVLII